LALSCSLRAPIRLVFAERDDGVHGPIGADVLHPVLVTGSEKYDGAGSQVGSRAIDRDRHSALADNHYLIMSVVMRSVRRQTGSELRDVHLERTAVVNRAIQNCPRLIFTVLLHRQIIESVSLRREDRLLRGSISSGQKRNENGEITACVLHVEQYTAYCFSAARNCSGFATLTIRQEPSTVGT
jgi:hypothetical protein